MFRFICHFCKRTYPPDRIIWRCVCGGYLDIEQDTIFNKAYLDPGKSGVWRYKVMIPHLGEDIISFGETATPLEKSIFEGQQIYFKHDYLFPGGSYKDRGNTVLVSWLHAMGITHVLEDSSGNAGASLSLYAAKAGIHAQILVPENTSDSKILQARACGAEVIKIKGNRKDTADEALKRAESCYYASHVFSPLFYHGTKTLAYELFEQLGDTIPDRIIFPVGNGSLLLGLTTAYRELFEAGLIKSFPQLIAVQHENYAPLHHAINSENDFIPESTPTMAEGIAVSCPLRLLQMKELSINYHVTVETVTEQEIVDALKLMFKSGYYIEPTSAVAFAAFRKLRMQFGEGEKIVVVLTGHGLKANNAIEKILKH